MVLMAYLLPIQVDSMFKPGAKMSGTISPCQRGYGHKIHTSALSVVGEVGALVTKGGGTDGDSLLGGGRGVVAGIGIVVTSGNGKVQANFDGSIDGHIKRGGLGNVRMSHLKGG